MKIANFTIYRIFTRRKILTSNVEEPLDLRRREFDLLELLMRNRGAALYRDVIFSRVWGGEPDSECLRTVDTHIARLRKKLGWTTEQLETIYRVGYRLKKE